MKNSKRIVWGILSLMAVFSFVLLYIPSVREMVLRSGDFIHLDFSFIYWYIGIIAVLMLFEFLYIYMPTSLGGTRDE